MASCDYKLCDVCGGKAFYDSNLQYDSDKLDENRPFAKEVGETISYRLGYLGDWAVLCINCAKTHKTQIVRLYE